MKTIFRVPVTAIALLVLTLCGVGIYWQTAQRVAARHAGVVTSALRSDRRYGAVNVAVSRTLRKVPVGPLRLWLPTIELTVYGSIEKEADFADLVALVRTNVPAFKLTWDLDVKDQHAVGNQGHRH